MTAAHSPSLLGKNCRANLLESSTKLSMVRSKVAFYLPIPYMHKAPSMPEKIISVRVGVSIGLKS